MSSKVALLLSTLCLLGPTVSGCDRCPTAADRVFEDLLSTNGSVAAGARQSFDVNNGIRSGNLVVVLTWTDPTVTLGLVTAGRDCDPVTNGACDEFGWGPSPGSATRIEAEVDASSIPRYTVTVMGDPSVASEFSLTVTFKEAICT